MAKKRKSRTPQPAVEEQQEHEAAPMEEPQNNEPQMEEQQEEQTAVDDDVIQTNELDQEEEPEEEIEEEEEEEEPDEETETETKAESNGAGDGDGVGEPEDLELDDEPVEKLLEPFSKEQLILLLKEAVSKHPEFIESVSKIADADPAHRKIFVHGLGWDTNADVLISEFEKYGEIEDCKAVVDKVSGKSKGYAFILFKHRAGCQKALKEPQKKIGNRMTSCQLASAGPVPAPPPTVPPVSEYTQRKIFVSNVAADIDPNKLLEFFSKFGEIDDGPLGLDKQTGKPRGFALFVYKSVESAKKALEEPHKIFEGHTLHCQKAVDGPKPTGKGFFGQGGGAGGHHGQFGGAGGHHHPSMKSKYSNSGGGHGQGYGGHLMAPAGPSVGYNPGGGMPPALTPALGQALTALLATQGGTLGPLGNLLGLGGQGGMAPGGYGNQGGGGYGGQGGYPNQQGGNRPQGGAPYMGHGH